MWSVFVRVFHLHGRQKCRIWLPLHSWVFAVLMVSTPFIVFGDSPHPAHAEPGSVFGLQPDLVKMVFGLLVTISAALIVRTLRQVDQNQNALFTNQRELARALTQLMTAHSINHQQPLDPPRLVGGRDESQGL